MPELEPGTIGRMEADLPKRPGDVDRQKRNLGYSLTIERAAWSAPGVSSVEDHMTLAA